jgi:ethanolamine utilization protein EutN
MRLARVIGTVVATRKLAGLHGQAILMIQPLDAAQRPAGAPLAAVDTVQAGPGELVWYTMAREAALALPDPNVAVDAAITGIVDAATRDDRGIVGKETIFAPARETGS